MTIKTARHIEPIGYTSTARSRLLTTLPAVAWRLRREADLLTVLADDANGAAAVALSDQAAALRGVARRVLAVAISEL